jgi:hypothetical protein
MQVRVVAWAKACLPCSKSTASSMGIPQQQQQQQRNPN